MNRKRIVCENCGSFLNERLIHEDEDGKSYCCSCMAWIVGIPPDQRPLKREDFDKMLKSMWHTPPLRLKDLKEQLKKEREEKKRDAKKKRSSK